MDFKKLMAIGKYLSEDLVAMDIGEEVISLCSQEQVSQYEMIPYRLKNNTLFLATANPNTFKLTLLLKEILKKDVNIIFTSTSNIKEGLAKYYNILNYQSNSISIEDVENNQLNDEDDEDDSQTDNAFNNRVNDIFKLAVEKGATDIHIIPNNKKVMIFLRINAELINFTESIHENLLHKTEKKCKLTNRIKQMCEPKLDTSTNMPQSGAIQYRNKEIRVDCRVSVLPSIRGEGIVIRLLDEKKEFKSLSKIGYSPQNIHSLKKVLVRPGGLVIITGPVNSGKSTSLYACINYYDWRKKCIITIEDPVEQKNEFIMQIQTHEAKEEKNRLTFGKGLREILRHDLNILLIGEIRDDETAGIAVRASLTGHKVFSTLHNKNVISTIDRLMNMGIDKRILLGELSCVISQRLLSTVCPACSKEYIPEEDERNLLDETAAKYLRGKKLKKASNVSCTTCDGTGYAGMVVVEECLVITDEIRDFLSQPYTLKGLSKFLSDNGFVTMQEKALEIVADGQSTIEKYLSTMPDNS